MDPSGTSDSPVDYFSEEDYSSDSDSENEIFSFGMLCSIFKDGDVALLKEVLKRKQVTPSVIYQTIKEGCFIDASEGGEHPHENIKCFKYLIKQGLDINAKDSEGNTPLHAACYYNSKAVPYILKKGGDPNIKNNKGDTPAHIYLGCFARSYNSLDNYILKRMIDHGLHLKFSVYDGRSYFFHYIPKRMEQFISILDLFIQNGFDINARYQKGNTLLHETMVQKIITELIPELFKRGFDFHARNDEDIDAIDSIRRIVNKGNLKEIIRKLEEEENDNQVKDPGFN